MKVFKWFKIFGCFLWGILLAGCLSTQYLERRQYLFDVPFPTKQKPITTKVLAVHPFTVTATSSSSHFVYRRGNGEYVIDYYHIFSTVPDQQLTEIFTAYLKHMIRVTENDMSEADYSLEPQLLALYADYQNQSHPTAVMKIRWVLRKESDESHKVVSDKTFSQAVPLSEKTTESLIASWNQALQNILQQTAHVLKTSFNMLA